VKVIRWSVCGLAAVLVGLLVVVVVALNSDGPLGPLAGGAFEAGETVTGPVDWAFLDDVDTLALALVQPPRSRTVWAVLHDGAAYVPCGLPGFRLWKQWPHEAVQDGRAVLRSDGRLYRGRLVKVEDASLHGTLTDLVAQKYDVGGAYDADTLWFFRFES
jgi:hypothetical protein